MTYAPERSDCPHATAATALRESLQHQDRPNHGTKAREGHSFPCQDTGVPVREIVWHTHSARVSLQEQMLFRAQDAILLETVEEAARCHGAHRAALVIERTTAVTLANIDHCAQDGFLSFGHWSPEADSGFLPSLHRGTIYQISRPLAHLPCRTIAAVTAPRHEFWWHVESTAPFG